jgi:hypothetical protein
VTPCTLASGILEPSFLAIAGDTIVSACEAPYQHRIEATKVTGGETRLLYSGVNGTGSLVTDGVRAYWTRLVGKHPDHAAVLSVPVAGGQVDTVFETPTWLRGGLAIDDERIFFGVDNTLFVRPRVGGKPLALASGPAVAEIVRAGDELFVTGDASIQRVPLAGGKLKVFVQTPNGARNLVYANGAIYFLHGDAIERAPLDGSARTVVVKSSDIGAFAVAHPSVYFTVHRVDGAVRKVDEATGVVTDVATAQHSPRAIALDATSLYWARVLDAAHHSGEILRVAR